MSIESKIPHSDEEINIRDLSLEQPEAKQQLPFDAEKEVTQKDWEGMLSELARYEKSGNWLFYGESAARMSILDNSKVPKPLPELATSALLDKLSNSLEPWTWAFNAYSLKLLRPDLLKSLQVSDEMWKKVNESLNKSRDPVSYAMMASNLKIAFPDKQKEWGLDAGACRAMVDRYNASLNRESNKEASELLYGLKVCFPDIVVDIPPQFWQKAKKRLDDMRADSSIFAWWAGTYKIIAAGELKITNDAFEIIPKKAANFGAQVALPEIKKF
jgi:hypothetical protein